MRNFVREIKKIIDKYYSLNLKSKQEIGTIDSWFVLNDRLEKAIVYSGGAGKDITFETELIEKYNCEVYLYDPSPTGIKTVNDCKSYPNLFFFPVGLASENKVLEFSLPSNPSEGSFTISRNQDTVKFKCEKLTDNIFKNGHDYVELLKLDIEGFEYGVLKDVLSSKIKVRQICIEYHHFFKEIPKSATEESIRLLKDNGYILFHKRNLDYSFYNPTI